MERKLFFAFAAFATATLLAFTRQSLKKENEAGLSPNFFKSNNIIRCSPDWNVLKEWIEEVDIPPIPGAGIYQWKISTKNDSAQFYFNQGINMYYSFHIIESMASFKKAAKFDPGCAMLYWAQALGYGPNINDLGYIASTDALAATSKAISLSETATPFEKALIRAMSVRYTADSADATRAKLNQSYTDKMKELYENFPANADALALYADAMMLQHPWDLWTPDGTAKSWTPLIEQTLEKLLALNPDHPGGNHYYIHVMEPSPFAAKALPSANRLGQTNPGLSHVVHMPSHIYLRTGYYNKGVAVNEDAVNSYKKSIPLYSAVTGADFLYSIHNLHMQTNNSMLAGRWSYSLQSAKETANSVPPDYLSAPGAFGNYAQYIHSTPLFVAIRFGKWDEILKYPAPSSSQIYANVLYHFAKGIAFSRKQNRSEASKELDQVREFMKDSSLAIPMSPFSSVIEGARVAEQILLGVIHEDKGLKDGAVRHYRMADSIETRMVYNEPRDWMLSPKHYLGNALLKAGKWKEAEKVFQDDLNYNNENGWSLYGQHKALIAQKKKTEAASVLARFKAAFEKADIKIISSVF